VTFRKIADATSRAVGTHWAFIVAAMIIVVWAVTGPMFHFSDTWQLVINTGTTIVTFLMVFLIQATQNRESRAVQLKLDELIRASEARNIFADLEDATDEEMAEFHEQFRRLRKEGLSGSDAAQEAARHLVGDES
jgi:low affinity Fe/Cu permease